MNIKSLQGPSKKIFINEQEIQEALAAMEQDACLNTSPLALRDADAAVHIVTFRERHTGYLKTHPKVNPEYYLSNLRTTIRIRATR